MSISSSLSNAASGLAAAARAANVISSNVANANTEGYGRRSLSLASNGIGGGVRVEGISRNVNSAAIADRRLADAALGNTTASLNFFAKMETSIGLPGEQGSLSQTIANFDTDLIAATSNPESTQFLSAVVSSAKSIVSKLNFLASDIKTARQDADASIASQVGQINTALQNVDDLNKEIRRLASTNSNTASLIDQRQLEIDKVAAFIPIREVPRDNGQVALVTTTGATLVDSDAARFEFSSTPLITPDMTLASGALSGLTLENAASSVGTAFQAIAGGALAATFELRDETTVIAQIQLDAVTRDLISRFSGPDADPTLLAGQAGLFTDAGSDLDPLNEQGISARISFNAAIDPSTGGDLTKLRDGIGAPVAGPAGENAILQSLREALINTSLPASGQFSRAGGFADLSTDYLGDISQSRQATESTQAFQSTRANALREIELQSGVSTDDELQKLLLVEQAYAANAKVIQSVDEMLQSLLRI